MCLTKRDDQTLATMGRLASYKPEMASAFAHSAKFDNSELQQSVVKFWDETIRPERLASKQVFCRALNEIESKENNNNVEHYEKLILHWVGSFSDKCIQSR